MLCAALDADYARHLRIAALRGRKLKDWLEERPRIVVDRPAKGRKRTLAELMKVARGSIDSGVPDLAHMVRFGRNTRHR